MKTRLFTKLMAVMLVLAFAVSLIPSVGADAKADDHIKVLFFGNSYSDDATDGGYFEDSMLYKMLKTMSGGAKITLGLGWSGGKTMAWHATAAANNTPMNFYYADNTEKWSWTGGKTTSDMLSYTDWDIVVLQPYGLEITSDVSQSMEGIDQKFLKTSESIPYMLDLIASKAPTAKAFLYIPFVASVDTSLNTMLTDYRQVATTMQTMETYKGKTSGLGFTKAIPVGAAVQAARGTYLATLEYNKDIGMANNNITTAQDPQIGLQRDGVHLSFSIGRYLANMVTAETIIPAEERAAGYTLPAMRESGAIGKLPTDYVDVLRVAADAAHASAQNSGKSKYFPKTLTGYTALPLDEAEAAIKAAALTVGGAEDKAALEALIADEVKEASGYDITVKATVKADYTRPAEGAEVKVSADVTITHGYSGSRSLTVEVTAKHKDDVILPVFTDVAEGAWYYEGVMYAASNGYMKGTNADLTTFSPDMQFTREQFVQLLFNMEGLNAADYAGDTGFSDVPAGQWYSAAVKWAKEAGVTSGIGNGAFGLGGKVTREQLAQFLKNYAEMCGVNTSARTDLNAFDDASSVSGWASDAVSFAVAAGLIGSTSTTAKVLAPGRVAIRSEIAKITMSYDAFLAK